MGHLSLVERSSSSWSFSFKPIGNFLKTKKEQLKSFEFYILMIFFSIARNGEYKKHVIASNSTGTTELGSNQA